MTTISVVIPVKDDAAMLSACLDALGRQSRPADEVIIVDNDSTDESAEIARRWGATIVFEAERGIWAAAAAGYDAATGDIILRCDADSVPGPAWIERIESELAVRPDAVAITGPGYFYDLPHVPRVIADLVYMRMYFAMMRLALGNRAVFGSNFAIRASTWKQIADTVHRHDAGVHDDMDLGYHLRPDWVVLFDRSITVGISGRPFTDLGSMATRTVRAGRTVAIHGPWDLPVSRWLRLAAMSGVRRRRRRTALATGRAPRRQQVP